MVKPTAQLWGGHREFGRMGHVTNQVSFGLAPFEQKTFVKVQNHFFNVVRRFRAKFLISGPPLLGGYYIYIYAKQRNLELSRKNPEDYKNDT